MAPQGRRCGRGTRWQVTAAHMAGRLAGAQAPQIRGGEIVARRCSIGYVETMRTVVCPGSFDPFTYGHLDVVRRARALSDRVIVAVAQNAAKSTLFSVAERLELARVTIESAQLTSVEVRDVPGLLTEFCAQMGAEHIVKGLRNGADLDGQLQ